MYVKRNIEVRSCNHCCIGKTMNSNVLNVCLALAIQHKMRMSRIVIYGLLRSAIFLPIVS